MWERVWERVCAPTRGAVQSVAGRKWESREGAWGSAGGCEQEGVQEAVNKKERWTERGWKQQWLRQSVGVRESQRMLSRGKVRQAAHNEGMMQWCPGRSRGCTGRISLGTGVAV